MGEYETMLANVPLYELDREVARAVAKLRATIEALGRGDPEATLCPLDGMRRVSSRASWLELAPPAPVERAGEALGLAPGEMPAPIVVVNPLREGLRAWVHVLTLERVLWADRVRLAAAWRRETVRIDQTDVGRIVLSPYELRRRLIAEPDRGLRIVFADALARGAGAVADAARILEERRAEASRRLPADLDDHAIPCTPPTAAQAIASALLRRTEPFTRAAGEHWHDAIAESIARDAAEGWPSRLNTRWIEALFRATGLTAGLRLELGDLPRALGASSFARALAAFGRAFADADGPSHVPFALAHPPFDLRRARRASLFGALVTDPVFHQRALGLGRDRARSQARRIAHALLRKLRLDAARVLLRGALLMPERQRSSLFEEHTATALFGVPIPPSLAGVMPSLSPDDPSALFGVLLAARDRRQLIEAFDEDWFQSPHAADQIRGEDSVLANASHTTEAELAAGLDALVDALGALG